MWESSGLGTNGLGLRVGRKPNNQIVMSIQLWLYIYLPDRKKRARGGGVRKRRRKQRVVGYKYGCQCKYLGDLASAKEGPPT